ncbi:hypothetical protein OM076_14640 [Solirubrobacter ginsenosidimutans]|uniref:Uncharacterized protein n=1 Tax=Solirubrobacter ginsenosidimutans TaxID=490573 RepID=A0A9X3MR99_9ACTN|nr:hypothetical protein [Solirubrobacter ginsenosidimutans]MDA0161511.1 hypothetical protein [Solirubrobacter ginsenosidimutans]
MSAALLAAAAATASVRDGAGNGADQLLVARPGRAVERLLYLPLGDTHSGSLAIAGLDSSGRRRRVTRAFDDAVSHRTFSL